MIRCEPTCMYRGKLNWCTLASSTYIALAMGTSVFMTLYCVQLAAGLATIVHVASDQTPNI